MSDQGYDTFSEDEDREGTTQPVSSNLSVHRLNVLSYQWITLASASVRHFM